VISLGYPWAYHFTHISLPVETRAFLQAADFDPDEPDSLSSMTIVNEEVDVFALAAEESLHGPPIEPSSPTSRGNRAWVIFNSQKLGIFETW
jgi:hypothetical protein